MFKDNEEQNLNKAVTHPKICSNTDNAYSVTYNKGLRYQSIPFSENKYQLLYPLWYFFHNLSHKDYKICKEARKIMEKSIEAKWRYFPNKRKNLSQESDFMKWRFDLPNVEFKMTIVKMITKVRRIMHDKIRNSKRNRKLKQHKEVMKVKNTTTDLKNSLEGFKGEYI